MRIQKLAFKTSLFLCFSLFITQCILADNSMIAVSSENISAFERRDVQEAVNEFCRTLLLDPENKTTQENLAAIISHPGLTAIQKSDVLLLEDLLRFIENLQGRINYLVSKRDLLEDQLIENGYNEEALFRNLFDIESNISRSREAFSYQGKILFDRKSSLVFINNLLMDEKAQLSLHLRFLQEQYYWLKAANKGKQYSPSYNFAQFVDTPALLYPQDVRRKESPEYVVSVLGEENGLEEKLLAEFEADSDKGTIAEVVSLQFKGADGEMTESSLKRFKSELGLLYVQLDKFEGNAEKKDIKIDELSGQVVDLSLRLSETEMLLDEKIEVVVSLIQELDDIKQRFVLGQRIIQEKGAQIQSLQETLQQAQSEINNQEKSSEDVAALKDQRVAELEASLRDYRKELARSNEGVQEKIRNLEALEKELADVQARFKSDRKAIQGRSEQMMILRSELADAQLKAEGGTEKFNTLLVGKDRELKELNGILNIYRQSLGDANQAIKEKGGRLDSLRDEVVRLQKRLAVEKAFLRETEKQRK